MNNLCPVFKNLVRLVWNNKTIDVYLTEKGRIDFKKTKIELTEEQINYININLNK